MFMPRQVKTEKLLDLSTSHIPRKTSIALGEDQNTPSASELWGLLSYTHWHSHGWIIFCSEEAATMIREAHPELADLMTLALQHGAVYLKLDGDAPQQEGVPTFDW
jgi:hypothetical protein